MKVVDGAIGLGKKRFSLTLLFDFSFLIRRTGRLFFRL
jgi:hypothetical protein